ncbi:Sorbitol dehydrogenase [Roseibaca ekhonensis]|jgi:L-iditol 2-dehydrogenase|uniref:Sorbitol dehydrogenase n=1 Tax=Roseinatronobacter ekhonensis TaxID=254356 RepID=A0A3B0M7U6_9RHOB|nr:alcohol dehydrogenase catalytic domain-containing protein [Roseibaca ekhonensis]SUZ32055.1 Sorbitol dehydrogenase [Roseibaca ekhonensis]
MLDNKRTMDALVLTAPREFGIQEIPIPTPETDEVLCKVDTTFICGTDPHIIQGDFPGFWPKEFPLVPGHEWSGTVVETGSRANALGWREGDRVCAISHVGCGYCHNCMTGRFNICLNYGHPERGHRQHGHYTPGAYAQYMCASVKSLYRIPDDMSLEYAACVDPLSIALYTVNRTRIQPGDDILIMGTGPQGLMAMLCAKAVGAGRIYVAGHGARLRLAEDLGAIGIDYRSSDVAKTVRDMTDGLGVPRVCECAGTATSIRQACDAAGKGGVVSVIGIPHEDVSLPLKRMVLDEVEIVGNRANPNTAQAAIALMSEGRVDLSPLMTHRFPLSQFAGALETYEGRRDGAMKVAIKPN